MELELDLGLSNPNPRIPILKELDLINYVNQVHYDDNRSCLSSQSSVSCNDNEGLEKKRKGFGFEEVESSVSHVVPLTLPLLLWDLDPNEQGKLPKRRCQSTSLSIAKNDGDGIVGWPPIKSYRKKFHQPNDVHHQYRCHRGDFPAVENGGRGSGCGGYRSMYVKVQMEGFGITRKIDLKLYHSYESLTSSLLTMFGKGQENVNGYKLTYQDREGDWLLAGDLPWRAFTGSVQRLKLIRRDD